FARFRPFGELGSVSKKKRLLFQTPQTGAAYGLPSALAVDTQCTFSPVSFSLACIHLIHCFRIVRDMPFLWQLGPYSSRHKSSLVVWKTYGACVSKIKSRGCGFVDSADFSYQVSTISPGTFS